MADSLILDLGLVALFGFLGAYTASRLGQPAITGYIVLGAVIGPYGLRLIRHTDTLPLLAELGVVFLMFFLGLEFSLKRLRQISNTVLFLGTGELVANFGVGLLAGYVLGLGIMDKLFLAAIVTMSSSSVVAKMLLDQRRTASPEAGVLMGVMVFEDFVAVLVLGVLAGVAAAGAVTQYALGYMLLKAVIFYGLVIAIGLYLLPPLFRFIEDLDADELFLLAMVGLILLAGAAADYFGLAAPAGAFLLGMLVSGEELELRLHRRLTPLRDLTLSIFFLSAGMLIDVSVIPSLWLLLMVVVPVSVLAEFLVTSGLAYLAGFRPAAAVSVGTGMIARGEYSLVYATLGYTAGILSPVLYQFTPVYVLMMTLISASTMRHSRTIAHHLFPAVPSFLRHGLYLTSSGLRLFLGLSDPLADEARETERVNGDEQVRRVTTGGSIGKLAWIAYFLMLGLTAKATGPVFTLLASAGTLVMVSAVRFRLRRALRHETERGRLVPAAAAFGVDALTALAVTAFLTAAAWPYLGIPALLLLVIFPAAWTCLSWRYHFAASRGQEQEGLPDGRT